ncbi:uncharacterized protein LOC110605909 [Manihot esculenta]|uniref:Histone deacetylase complex subunit SAP30 Sin3 binding domain-containing protein n=1 Tax=Manihot esculenta TaxID=3983 RepID=A0A2C9WCH8_MANES|nr:uncharacterized protein LOC110605909 [Manihot esculenta]XP_043806975.1 uncharacterized protein LOC110605909 [Manihot esculenta]OAY56498.1 hypothetical protein MANES_02G021494v8 [Manihot esculenta]
MLETELYSSRILSPFREESCDEELSVLPRHTKVIVTGNNRTKSVLVGLQGVVKKAVGLGGWHWLVLKNGVEVKLQRNALSVLARATGSEVVDEDNDVDTSSGSEICSQDHDFSSGTEFLKFRKPRVRSTRPRIPLANSTSSSGCVDAESIIHPLQSKVNLAKLSTESLRRYCRSFNLEGVHSKSTRDQMLNVVQQHFASQQPLDEVQVIEEFIKAKKRKKLADRPTE